ncbi:hypothetical protein HMPREF9373_1530 [Psychrobacter sp. 1501(2011)]|nr:hypothetical protein HMPREF9373_1530 [Psychrobacter sp. 1501(2011)]
MTFIFIYKWYSCAWYLELLRLIELYLSNKLYFNTNKPLTIYLNALIN